jgi:hypothetical protein
LQVVLFVGAAMGFGEDVVDAVCGGHTAMISAGAAQGFGAEDSQTPTLPRCAIPASA